MVEFIIPLKSGGTGDFIEFRVHPMRLLFAGSRYRSLDPVITDDLLKYFDSLGFSFLTGCAKGIDASFRRSLLLGGYRDRSMVACAFKERAEKMRGLCSLYVVPRGLPAKVALAKRTLWMTQRCTMLVLFPSSPIGKGSSLAFRSTIMGNKPVFVVGDTRPVNSDLYQVFPSSLSGIVQGWWCLPPVYHETGLCCEEL